MKSLIIISLLLTCFSALAQNSFSFEELQEIYLANDKAKAIQTIKSKGYTPASADEVREFFGRDLNGSVLYSRSTDASKIGIDILNNKFQQVIFVDSTVHIKSLLHEAEKTGFVLTRQEVEISKVYVSKKTSYFVWYSVLNGVSSESSIISIIEKTKANKLLYHSNR